MPPKKPNKQKSKPKQVVNTQTTFTVEEVDDDTTKSVPNQIIPLSSNGVGSELGFPTGPDFDDHFDSSKKKSMTAQTKFINNMKMIFVTLSDSLDEIKSIINRSTIPDDIKDRADTLLSGVRVNVNDLQLDSVNQSAKGAIELAGTDRSAKLETTQRTENYNTNSDETKSFSDHKSDHKSSHTCGCNFWTFMVLLCIFLIVSAIVIWLIKVTTVVDKSVDGVIECAKETKIMVSSVRNDTRNAFISVGNGFLLVKAWFTNSTYVPFEYYPS